MESQSKFQKIFRLTEKETKIYIQLYRVGTATARELSNKTGFNRVTTYNILKNLQKKGLSETTFKFPTQYSIVPLDQIFNGLILEKKEELANLEINKKEVISKFKQIYSSQTQTHYSKFSILHTRKLIFSKLRRMIKNTEKNLKVSISSQGILSAFQTGIWKEFPTLHQSNGYVQLVTNLSDLDLAHVILTKLEKITKKSNSNFKPRLCSLKLKNFPRFILSDDKELLFFLESSNEINIEKRIVNGFWTNNVILVNAFMAFFEDLWKKSKDFQ